MNKGEEVREGTYSCNGPGGEESLASLRNQQHDWSVGSKGDVVKMKWE